MVRKMQTSRGRVLGIFNAAMDGVISTNEHQDVNIVNPAAERIFGYSAADLLGKPVETLLPLEKREAHRRHIRYFGATGVSARTMYALGEIRGLHAAGHEIPLEATISQATVEDEKILHGNHARRYGAPKQSERIAAAGGDSGFDGGRDYRQDVGRDNHQLEQRRGEVYGYTKEEIIGQSVGILIPPDMPDELGSILAKMRRGESIIQYRTRRRHRSGTILIISLTISPVKDGRGNNIGFSTIARDVSNHVQTEENLRISGGDTGHY